MSDKAVTLYSKATCPFCIRAKALFERKGVDFEEIDILDEPERRDEMIQRSGGRTVPQIFIHGKPIGGYDELAALEQDGELDRILG